MVSASEATFDGYTVAQITEACGEGYMASEYGEENLRKIVLFLLGKGLSAYEVEAVCLSKHLRWADDMEGEGNGKKTDSAAFKRYYRRVAHASKQGPTFWKTEAAELVETSSLNLDGGLGSEEQV